VDWVISQDGPKDEPHMPPRDTRPPFGMLSFQELETGLPLADSLKSPANSVWILHGGDHFTLLFSSLTAPLKISTTAIKANTSSDTGGLGDESAKIVGKDLDMWHWNGLPPAGPKLTRLAVNSPVGEISAAPPRHIKPYIKPVPGEIDEVVQAHPADKKSRPNAWMTWKYEVVLAMEDPTVQDSRTQEDVHEIVHKSTSHGAEGRGDAAGACDNPTRHIFELPSPKENGLDQEPWRCATCYRGRFKTMCFGQNNAGIDACVHCGKWREDAGFSIWLSYSELPPNIQSLVSKRYAPKVLNLLRTKWPHAQVEYCSEPSV